ncbi:hypothetical protein JGU48_07270 [Staphylococcus aureus]|uniref:hypothetical protein n=1 Tax=Staphylococcus aureus TaxID=1280 RepID=UPI0018EE3296|nr:hypothetical protein [Staphylococcus aureus]MBJ6274894.1 hypothetical protein [Staphylococcus aureus]MBJ6280009.1 hypothetical protein [Staphylococcus aureus]MBJ6282685.1 hypothetical protein [Staphylococcus aureus]MBJ6285008.1 hypothetical protein [Staphylococcus aureus]MBJ6300273.1 hypothetical protein [Staphylococcus aureus]
MDKEQLKKYIYDYVKEQKEIPIYQLEDLFKEMDHDYIGKTSVTHDKDKNIVFWSGWSKVTMFALIELVKSEQLDLVYIGSYVMRYLLDGRVTNLPLAICYPEDGQQTDVPSWVPMVLRINKEEKIK